VTLKCNNHSSSKTSI